MKIELAYVRFMPEKIKSAILYVSKDFDIAVHLCPCGCGSKIRTPLGPTEWSVEETEYGPTLYPSVGNWQLQCRSHYWIRQGRVVWAEKWNTDQIKIGRRFEEKRRELYYNSLYQKKIGLLQKFLIWLRSILH